MGATTLLGATLCVLIAVSSASILGIDFGAEYIKAGTVSTGKARGFDIVLDAGSNRKSRAYVSLHEGERHYSDAGFAVAGRYPESVLGHAKYIIGRSLDDDLLSVLGDIHARYELKADDSRGGTPSYMIGDNEFSAEEVVAMLLSYIQGIANAHTGMHIQDVVLTVPPYFTHHQRQAMKDAAELAGLNVLGILNEQVAAAIQYGLKNRKMIDTPEHDVVVFDMGSGSTKVSWFTFVDAHPEATTKKKPKFGVKSTLGKLLVRSHSWEDTVGGFSFDAKLASHFVAAFEEKYGVNLSSNKKAMNRFMKEARRVKEVLSANMQTRWTIESVDGERDISGIVTRDEFEDMCSELFERALLPVKHIMDAVVEDGCKLQSFEMIGGSSYIPKLQDMILDYIKRPILNRTLNADEAIAIGATYYAATRSAAYTIQEFDIKDINPYVVDVHVTRPAAGDEDDSDASEGDDGMKTTTQVLFKPGNRLGSKKALKFRAETELLIDLTYSDDSLPYSTNTHIATFNISGSAGITDGRNLKGGITTQVGITVNKDGIFELSNANVLFDEEVTVTERRKVNATEAEAAAPAADAEKDADNVQDGTVEEEAEEEEPAADAGDESGDDSGEQTGEEGDNEQAADDEEGDSAGSEDGDSDDSDSEGEGEADGEAADGEQADAAEEADSSKNDTVVIPPEDEYIEEEVVKVVSRKIDLPQEIKLQGTLPLSKETRTKSREVLRKLDDVDRELKMRAKEKNDLESLVYRVKEQLWEDYFDTYSTEDEREELKAILEDTGDWIDYDVTDETPTQEFVDRRVKISDIYNAVQMRQTEADERPAVLKRAYKTIEGIRANSSDWEETRPHITEEEREGLLNRTERFESWLKNKTEEQDELEANQDPAFRVSEVDKKVKRIMQDYKKLLKKRAPRKKPVKKDKKDGEKPFNLDGLDGVDFSSMSKEELDAFLKEKMKDIKLDADSTATADDAEAAAGEEKGDGEPAEKEANAQDSEASASEDDATDGPKVEL